MYIFHITHTTISKLCIGAARKPAHVAATGATWKREFFLKVMPVGSTSESWSRRPWRIHQIARFCQWETYSESIYFKLTFLQSISIIFNLYSISYDYHLSSYFYIHLIVYCYFKHVQCMTNFLGQTCWTQAVLEELVRLVSTDRKPYKLEILGQESELERFETSRNSQTAAHGTWRLEEGLLKLKWHLLSVLCRFVCFCV